MADWTPDTGFVRGGLFKHLPSDEEREYREFARTLYSPREKLLVNPVHHPVVRHELACLIAAQAEAEMAVLYQLPVTPKEG